jgi:hypothetical protein
MTHGARAEDAGLRASFAIPVHIEPLFVTPSTVEPRFGC